MIPQSQVVFASASLIDDAGRVFLWNDGIYRAIYPNQTDFYRNLLGRGVLDDIFDTQIIRTSISPHSLEGYPLTLTHKRLPFESWCIEWTARMLRDAALLYCDLVTELARRGLGLKDAHPWNVLFDRGFPVFIDFGSIIDTAKRSPNIYLEYESWFILPLLLMSAGLNKLARTLMLNPGNPPTRRDVLRLLISRVPHSTLLQYWFELRRLRRIGMNNIPKAFTAARRFIEAIPVNTDATEWTEYLGPGSTYSENDPGGWPAKSLNVQSVLNQVKPKTVMDIGCNRGWFSSIAAKAGAQTVALDIDEPNLDYLYQRVRALRLPVLPTLMDFCTPTPGFNYRFQDASARLKSEMVMALAITHHLVFKRNLSFEFIAERLSSFSARSLIVEFVPPDDKYVREWMNDKFDWYCQDGFILALRRYFHRIEVKESTPSPRVLLICEK